MSDPLHADRVRAESFGACADAYDATRPRYPAEAVAAILGPEPNGIRVLDVGCGTGIASRLLADAGAEVLGVEPDPAMAELARRSGTMVEAARFEQWDPAGRTFDRVVAAQAWHWVDPAIGARRAAEVLVPGGRICLLWNQGSFPQALGHELDAVYDDLAADADRFSVLLGQTTRNHWSVDSEPARQLRATGRFSGVATESFSWEKRYSTEAWLAQLVTHSDHSRLPVAARERLLDAVAATIERHGGAFTMRYEAHVLSGTRR